jgi:hypothetical protein
MPEGETAVPAGIDYARGAEPTVVRRRLVTPKDDAILAARAAGAQVLEGRYAVRKYRGEVAEGNLYEVVETAPNLFLTAGITEVLKLATGATATAFSSSNARLAVGDSSTSASAGQTDLQASSNKLRKIVDGTPSVSTNSVTFTATFGTGDANFAWNEVGVVNASSSGAMWSRTVASLGTKTSAASWVLSWTLSIS